MSKKILATFLMATMIILPSVPAHAEGTTPPNNGVPTQIINFGTWSPTTTNNTVNNTNVTNNTVNNISNTWNWNWNWQVQNTTANPTATPTSSATAGGLTEQNSKDYLMQNDGDYINQRLSDQKGGQLRYRGKSNLALLAVGWGDTFKNEEAYMYDVVNPAGEQLFSYLIGDTSSAVYCIPPQGGMALYKVQDNKVVQAYGYNGTSTSYWRW
jgi:hypothetical protein